MAKEIKPSGNRAQRRAAMKNSQTPQTRSTALRIAAIAILAIMVLGFVIVPLLGR